MTTPEQDFKQRFVAVLQDLQTDGKNDPEAMAMIGNLATDLIDKAKAKSWRGLKQGLTREAYDGLLEDFRREGNAQAKAGRMKQAYAIQVLAVSLIARTQLDRQMQQGDRLMDELVDAAVGMWRRHLRNVQSSQQQ